MFSGLTNTTTTQPPEQAITDITDKSDSKPDKKNKLDLAKNRCSKFLESLIANSTICQWFNSELDKTHDHSISCIYPQQQKNAETIEFNGLPSTSTAPKVDQLIRNNSLGTSRAANHFQRKDLQKQLDQLFKLDSGDPNHSIENFYNMTVNKLIGFANAVKVLNSGLVARNTSWKDSVGSGFFTLFESLASLPGVSIIVIPILSGADYLFENYRNNKKKVEFNRASEQFNEGFESIEEQSQMIAYQLAHLLQMQLRYCTLEGTQKIADDWLYRLCYNLLKADNRTDDEAETIVSDLLRIKKGKEIKHKIETYAKNRHWNTLGLFNKAGIAYYHNDQLIYESCYLKNLDHTPISISRAEKYGYLIFANDGDAMMYKSAITKELQTKYKKNGQSIEWKQNIMPLGPQIHTEDQYQISSPTLVPTKRPVDSTPPLDSSSDWVDRDPSLPSSQIAQLESKLEDLEKINSKLSRDLQEQTDKLQAQAEKIELIEANMKKLMELLGTEKK